MVVVLVLMMARLAGAGAGAAPSIHVTVTGIGQTKSAARAEAIRARFAAALARVDAASGAFDLVVVESRTPTEVTIELRVVVSDAAGIRSVASASARTPNTAPAELATRAAIDAVVERLRPRARVAAK